MKEEWDGTVIQRYVLKVKYGESFIIIHSPTVLGRKKYVDLGKKKMEFQGGFGLEVFLLHTSPRPRCMPLNIPLRN